MVKGKVTDSSTGDPIPFASVLLKGTTVGISTDFEGNYSLGTKSLTDSIMVSYLGYISATKPLLNQAEQTVNFQLKPSDFEMETFVFTAGENPAFEIIRQAVNRKKDFDKRELRAYQTKNYTKIEIDIDHVSEEFSKRKS
ncbi:MAG: carboxypeptidase-like regulatory domain-containing protein, partial [Algoriphagus sp.]